MRAPPLAVIGDAQSCNVLVAELAFEINSRYGLGGQSLEAEDNFHSEHAWSAFKKIYDQ